MRRDARWPLSNPLRLAISFLTMTDHSAVSAASDALHDRLLTLDTHIDIPWPDRDDFFVDTAVRQVDAPKLQRGGLKAVCLAAYIPQARLDDAGHDQAWTRVRAMLDVITGLKGGEAVLPITVCTTVAAVMDAYQAGRIAVIPAVENGYAIGSEVARVRELARRGVRYITLTHNGHNALADAAIPRKDLNDSIELHGGLSAIGRAAIREMNACGIVVDVSHASRNTMMQAADLSAVPIVASHSCARALCDHPRNLDDAQLDRLAATGGVIQVTAMSSFLKPSASGRADVDDLARHVSYIAGRIGVAHVGVSSDFDGGGGIEGWVSAAESANVTQALLRQGFSEADIAAIWGGNFLRVLSQAEALAQAWPIAEV